MRRFNQPYLIQSNNASLSIRFRMDPATGADQVIEGAFAYYNGEFLVSFQSTILGILETVPSEFMRFYVLLFVVFFLYKWSRARRFQETWDALRRALRRGSQSCQRPRC